MRVQLRWTRIRPNTDELWRLRRVLYAYTTPDLHEVLYVGKALTTTVAQRWDAADKSFLWRDLESDRGVFGHQVIVGVPLLPEHFRFSGELLADIESLLICRVEPWGNIQCRNSRICRPGLTVQCIGEWPHPKRLFHDR
jgi:hypothetical protein